MRLLRTVGGGRIDRSRPLRFTFDGRPYQGFAGDTLASALIANGVHCVGRSYKYHRPRGILSAGVEEPNALVDVNRGNGCTTPNLRATQVELYAGLCARSQNRWPSLLLDVGAVNDLMSPLIAAGFYYKTFMGPRFLGQRLCKQGEAGIRYSVSAEMRKGTIAKVAAEVDDPGAARIVVLGIPVEVIKCAPCVPVTYHPPQR